MKFALALVALSSLALVTAANAADAPRLTDCNAMAKQVTAALESAQPGAATDAARREAAAGRNLCDIRLFAPGVARYNKALQLLGRN
jgi:hypothetical protein